MYWDEAQRLDVIRAAWMFFACAVRPESVRSLPTKVELLPEHRIRLTSYFRMPFWRKRLDCDRESSFAGSEADQQSQRRGVRVAAAIYGR